MIPRTLVPVGARPPADPGATSRRRPTNLDERKLVPAMLPVIPLNGHSSIPANLPLESIAARVVVPRDVKPEAYAPGNETALPPQPSELDERIAVPAGAAPPAVIEPISVPPPADIVELDVFMTGEVNLIPEPPKEGTAWNQIATRAFSISMHLLLVLLIIFQAKLFPHREPTPQETEFAKNQLRLLLPPGAFEPAPPRPPQPRVRVDPRVLKRVAPPEPAPAPVVPAPAPVPEKPKELPNAPTPQPNASPPPATPEPKTEALAPKPKLETPDTPQPRSQLILPKDTSRSLQDVIREAQRNPNAGGRSGGVIGPMPKSQAPGGLGSAGQGSGTYGNGWQILTPTEGVDFSDYMARVLASVRRNWYAVMPQSAMMGEQGRVALQFRIMRDGSVPDGEPVRLLGSGKEPLDRAAVSAIRSSNPFEPLPGAFKGPYIELRFYFLYNLPLEAAYQ